MLIIKVIVFVKRLLFFFNSQIHREENSLLPQVWPVIVKAYALQIHTYVLPSGLNIKGFYNTVTPSRGLVTLAQSSSSKRTCWNWRIEAELRTFQYQQATDKQLSDVTVGLEPESKQNSQIKSGSRHEEYHSGGATAGSCLYRASEELQTQSERLTWRERWFTEEKMTQRLRSRLVSQLCGPATLWPRVFMQGRLPFMDVEDESNTCPTKSQSCNEDHVTHSLTLQVCDQCQLCARPPSRSQSQRINKISKHPSPRQPEFQEVQCTWAFRPLISHELAVPRA